MLLKNAWTRIYSSNSSEIERQQNVRFVNLGRYATNSVLYCNFSSNGKCLLAALERGQED